MSVAPPQMVQVACPNCRSPLRAPVVTLIDAGRQPELKSYLLSGQLNMLVCPNCGNVTMIAAPLIYHDPNKQLFLVHFPQQLNARPEDQERFIGDATSMLMRSLGSEVPKAYLLAPKRFLTLNSLIEAVLEADGISKEMIEAQRRRVDLISDLAEAYEQGEPQLQALVDQHRAELDEEFFGTLAAFIQASAANNRDESTVILNNLYQKLVELTGFEGTQDDEDGEELSLDEVIDQLLNVPDEQLEQTIAELRYAIDYDFFETLTERIDAATAAGDTAAAERLTTRRQQILETTERLDTEARQMFEAGAKLLREVMEAEDPAEVLRTNHQQIDEAFLLLLESTQQTAARDGRADVAGRLAQIHELAVQTVQDFLPPEDRFINQLLQAEQPQQATQLLRQNMAQVTTAFVKRLNELADQFEQQGRQPTSERLRQLSREAAAMLF
ncbi:MAG: CpXC domain-containing protein [Roseiflexaceae bacterium]